MRLLNFNIGCVGLAFLLAPAALAGDPPAKSAATAPGPALTATTNLNRMNVGQPSLKDQIKEDLLRPFHNGSQNPFEPVLPPMPTYRSQRSSLSKRDRDEMKMEVEKIYFGQKDASNKDKKEDKDDLRQMLGVKNYGADGKEKKELTPLEKFYAGPDKEEKAPSASEQLRKSMLKGGVRDFAGTNAFSQSHYTYKDQWGNETTSQDASESGSQDVSPYQAANAGNNDSSLTAEERAERASAKKHGEAFQKLLGDSPTAPSGFKLFGGSGGNNSVVGGGSPKTFDASSAQGVYGANSTLGGLLGGASDAPGASGSVFSSLLYNSTPAPAAPVASSLNPFSSGGGTPGFQPRSSFDSFGFHAPGASPVQPRYEEPARPAANASPQSSFGFLPQTALPQRKF